VRTLLAERLVNARKLRLRVQQLGRSRIPADTLLRWLDATVREIYDDLAAGVESARP
jgi:hypothetical protein